MGYEMAQTTLSVRMDETVKKQFDTFCSEVGMNTSVAINLFAKVVFLENEKSPSKLLLLMILSTAILI